MAAGKEIARRLLSDIYEGIGDGSLDLKDIQEIFCVTISATAGCTTNPHAFVDSLFLKLKKHFERALELVARTSDD